MSEPDQLSLFDYQPEEEEEPPTARSQPEADSVGVALNPGTSLAAALEPSGESRRRAGLSENTIKNYRVDIQLLADYAGGGAAVGQFTTQTLNDCLDWMRNRRKVPCSNKTLDRRITALKSFFRWLTIVAGLMTDPAKAVVNISVRSPLPVILTEAEIQQALAAADRLQSAERRPDMRPYVLFTFLLHTGLRKGETARLVTNHLDLSDSERPHLFVRYSDKIHRHKERKVALDPEWVETYREYADEYRITQQVFPWSVRLLEYLLEDITNAASLHKHISFDMVRWTCAIRDYQAGLETQKLRRKLGLSSVQWSEVRRKISKLAE